MRRTLGDFCSRLTAKGATQRKIPPDVVAGYFVRYFGLSLRPRLAELTQVLEAAGVGSVTGDVLPDGLLGVHFSTPQAGHEIRYRQDQWDPGKEHTVLHETYEIIQERLFPRRPSGQMWRLICRDADRFAAAVLMQAPCFADFALASGLDLVELQRQYRCSFAMVASRLAQVLYDQPLLVALYERRYRVDAYAGPEPDELDDFVVRVVAHTPGGRSLSRCVLVGGFSRQMPVRGLPPVAGSAAAAVIRRGKAWSAEEHTRVQTDENRGIAVAAKPVLFQKRLAKVSIVASSYQDRDVFSRRIGYIGQDPRV